MERKNLNVQIISIFVVIFAAFIGSAVLFFRIHTSVLKSSIEVETHLFSSLLTNTLINEYTFDDCAHNPHVSETLQSMVDEQEADNLDLDVWIISKNGSVLCCDNKINDDEKIKEIFSEISENNVSYGWTGNKEILFLRKNFYIVSSLYSGEAYLVTLNYCVQAHALQRQQSALFGGAMLTLFVLVVVLIANLINNYRTQLIHLATIDELTGLSNRKSFNTEFSHFAENKNSQNFSLFLLDVDYFKQINDTKGHATGDFALHFLADKIKEVIEKYGGFAGRWGGDEFIGVLFQNGSNAVNILNQLCKEIALSELPDGLKMTISAGVAEFESATDFSKISEKADIALYVSKEHGRNQATLYQKGMVSKTNSVALNNEIIEKVENSEVIEKEKKENSTEEIRRSDNFSERLKTIIKDKLMPSVLRGVRWMAPFIAGGGILIAFAFLFDAASVDLSTLPIEARSNFGSITPLSAALKEIGGITFNFMLPVFAGFMAVGLAGDDAFLAGFVGGYMTIQSNSGFVGAMFAGLVAGIVSNEIQKFTGRLPKVIQKAAPIIIFPVFNLILMQVITMLVITPISSVIGNLFAVILSRTEAMSEILTGTLASTMMAIDMGGIINKVAYNYGVDGLLLDKTRIMACVMIGGMVPPIGLFLSMLIFSKKYDKEEKDRRIPALFMGLSFITEGALPYVFTDPLRVIPCCMVGSAIAGFFSVLFKCELPAPHGGMFVLPVMTHPFLYIISLIIGSITLAVLLGIVKKEKI